MVGGTAIIIPCGASDIDARSATGITGRCSARALLLLLKKQM